MLDDKRVGFPMRPTKIYRGGLHDWTCQPKTWMWLIVVNPTPQLVHRWIEPWAPLKQLLLIFSMGPLKSRPATQTKRLYIRNSWKYLWAFCILLPILWKNPAFHFQASPAQRHHVVRLNLYHWSTSGSQSDVSNGSQLTWPWFYRDRVCYRQMSTVSCLCPVYATFILCKCRSQIGFGL